jgi:hypothetical protein
VVLELKLRAYGLAPVSNNSCWNFGCGVLPQAARVSRPANAVAVDLENEVNMVVRKGRCGSANGNAL